MIESIWTTIAVLGVVTAWVAYNKFFRQVREISRRSRKEHAACLAPTLESIRVTDEDDQAVRRIDSKRNGGDSVDSIASSPGDGYPNGAERLDSGERLDSPEEKIDSTAPWRTTQLYVDEKRLQHKFLYGWFLCAFGDWLQGPLIFQMAFKHLEDEGLVYQLQVIGYLSGMIFAFFIGSLADKYSRKRACQTYCIVYMLGCVLIHFRSYWAIFGTRVLGGIGTGILYTAFESYYIKQHGAHKHDPELMGGTVKLMWEGNYLLAIFAGFFVAVLLQTIPPYAHLFGNFYVGGEVAVFDFSFLSCLAGLLYISFTWEYDEDKTKTAEQERTKERFSIQPDVERRSWVNRTSTQLRDVVGKSTGGIASILRDPSLWKLGIVVSLTEAAMFIFIPSWDPALTFYGGIHIKEDPGSTINRGALFAAFMMACMLGVEYYEVRAKKGTDLKNLYGEGAKNSCSSMLAFLFMAILLFPSSTFFRSSQPESAHVPLVWTLLGFLFKFEHEVAALQVGYHVIMTVLCALILWYEFSVGFSFPLLTVVKAKVVPEEYRTTVYNMYRIPLNGISVLVLLLPELTLPWRFLACGGLTLIVWGAYVWLANSLEVSYGGADHSLGRKSLRNSALHNATHGQESTTGTDGHMTPNSSVRNSPNYNRDSPGDDDDEEEIVAVFNRDNESYSGNVDAHSPDSAVSPQNYGTMK